LAGHAPHEEIGQAQRNAELSRQRSLRYGVAGLDARENLAGMQVPSIQWITLRACRLQQRAQQGATPQVAGWSPIENVEVVGRLRSYRERDVILPAIAGLVKDKVVISPQFGQAVRHQRTAAD